MKDDATIAHEHYFSDTTGNTVYFHGSDSGALFVRDMLTNGMLHPGDAPDLVITHDNVALIIEHFEFDSYRVTRKGSCSRTEQARIDRKFNEQPIGSVYIDRIKGASSYDDYLANATRSFTIHYKHISMYKKNLKKDGIIKDTTIVKTMFLIEDVSPIGTMVFSEESDTGIAPVVLAQSPEFLELLAQSPNVDYVLCCSSAGQHEYIWLIDRDEIDCYRENACDYKKMRFIFSNPNVVCGSIMLPNK